MATTIELVKNIEVKCSIFTHTAEMSAKYHSLVSANIESFARNVNCLENEIYGNHFLAQITVNTELRIDFLGILPYESRSKRLISLEGAEPTPLSCIEKQRESCIPVAVHSSCFDK